MGKDVKDQTNLVLRDGVYYFRARVPKDLQEHYGKKEHFYSLRTKDKGKAAEKARLERVKFDQAYAHLKAVRDAARVQELPPVELERLASFYYAKLLADDEDIRARGLLMLPVPGHDVFDLYGKASAGFAKRDGERYARGDVTLPDADMDAFLEQHGIKLDPASEVYRKAAYAFTRERRRAGDAIAARHRGEVFDTPPEAAEAVSRAPTVPHREDTLDALLAYWEAQKVRPDNTVKETKRAVRLLRKITGDALPASRVEKRHLVQLKDELLTSGTLQKATVLKYINLLRAVFQAAVDNDKLPKNPAAGVKVPKDAPGEPKRVPLNLESLRTLFHSEVYTQGKRPAGGAGEAAYWLPLLGLWTGARLDELGQLEVGSVKREEGVWYLDFAPDPAKGKRLKNANSRRRVPIHPELLRCGFLAYVERTKTAGHSWLFPRLSAAPDRKRTASFSQWFGRYRRQLGITGEREVFHSFRHGFMEAGRAAGLTKELRHQFTGHGTRDEGDGYGGWPLPTLAEAMARIRYDGLDLSHLHKPAEAAPEGET